MGNCLEITGGIIQDCLTPPVEGVKTKVWIIPKSDFDEATITMNAAYTNVEVIKDITLPLGGKKAYVFEGYKSSQQMSTTTKEREFAIPVYTHQWTGVIIPRTIADKVTLDRLIKSRFVMIVQNHDKGAVVTAVSPAVDYQEMAFELYGRENGLAHMESSQVKNENAGGWAVTFATPETESEPAMPISIFDTTFADTLKVIEKLETPTALS
jgi:hypothetical protein